MAAKKTEKTSPKSSAKIEGMRVKSDDQLSGDLADNIPHRGLEPGHRRVHHRASIVFDLVEAKPQVFDAKRVVSDEVTVGEFMHERLDCEFLPAERSVTPAHHAVIGGDLDDKEVAPRAIDDEGLDSFNVPSGGRDDLGAGLEVGKH